MKVEIWSDFACPFCYLGEKKMKLALEEMGIEDQVEVSFKSFQLDPNATSHPDESIHELIAHKYGISVEQAKANNDRIVQAAKAVGLQYDFDQIKPGNTADAHIFAKLAKTQGLEEEVVENLFSYYFEQGRLLENRDTLLEIAGKVGLPEEMLLEALESESYQKAILEDQETAYAMGIQSVPFFVVDGQYGISGAQDVEAFKQVFNKVIF